MLQLPNLKFKAKSTISSKILEKYSVILKNPFKPPNLRFQHLVEYVALVGTQIQVLQETYKHIKVEHYTSFIIGVTKAKPELINNSLNRIEFLITENLVYKFATCGTKIALSLCFLLEVYDVAFWLILCSAIAISLLLAILKYDKRIGRVIQTDFGIFVDDIWSSCPRIGQEIPKSIMKANNMILRSYRLAFGAWALMAVVISSAYKGVVVSYLTSLNGL